MGRERDLVVTFVSRLIQLLLVLVGVRAMTTLLPPDEVGKVALIGAVTTFCALFLVSPLGTFINRRLHSWHRNGTLRAYFRVYSIYLFALASLCAVVLMLAMQQRYVALDSPVAGVMAVVWASLFLGTLQQTYVPSLNMLGRNNEFAALNLMGPAIGLALSIGLVWFFNARDAVTWLIGVALSQLMLYLIASRIFFSKELGRESVYIDRKKLTGLWRFSWPVALTLACTWLQFQGYRFVLADYAGYAALGYFVAGYGVAAGLFGAFEQVVMSWFMPRFYRQANGLGEDSGTAWVNYAACVLPLSVLCFGAVFSLADLWVSGMLGPAFQNTQIYVQLGAMSEWLRVVLSVYGLVAHQSMRTRTLVLPQLVGALIALGLVVWVAATGNFQQVPLAFAAGSLVSFVLLRMALGRGATMSAQGQRWLAASLSCCAAILLLNFAAHGWIHSKDGAWTMGYAALLFLLWGGIGAFFLWYISRTSVVTPAH